MIIQINWFIDLPLQDVAVFSMGAGIFLIAFGVRRRGEERAEYNHGLGFGGVIIPTAAIIYSGGVLGIFLLVVGQSQFIASIPLGITGSIILGGGSALFYQKAYDVIVLRQFPTTPGGIVQRFKIQLLFVGLIITAVGCVISYGAISPKVNLPQTLLFAYTMFVFLSSSGGVTYRLLSIDDEVANMALSTYAQYLLIIGIILITAGASIVEFSTINHEIYYDVILSKLAYGVGFWVSVRMMYD